MREFAAKGNAFPKCSRARTGNGGFHLFFRWQAGIGNSAGKVGKGVDVKSTGGYVVAAPSWTGPSKQGPGGPYTWEVSPFEAPVPRLPIWLATKINPPPRPQRIEFNGPVSGDISGLVRFVTRASEGERNKSLYWAACRARGLIEQGLASEPTVISALSQAAVSCGLDVAGTLRTIHSGLHGAASGDARG